jgi:hypothetical protein
MQFCNTPVQFRNTFCEALRARMFKKNYPYVFYGFFHAGIVSASYYAEPK